MTVESFRGDNAKEAGVPISRSKQIRCFQAFFGRRRTSFTASGAIP
jgi:hypothetical protein